MGTVAWGCVERQSVYAWVPHACLNLLCPGEECVACRYDGLVGQFSPKQIPSVGVSVGIERVFAVLEGKFRARAEQNGASIRETRTQVSLLSGKHCKSAQVKAWQV